MPGQQNRSSILNFAETLVCLESKDIYFTASYFAGKYFFMLDKIR